MEEDPWDLGDDPVLPEKETEPPNRGELLEVPLGHTAPDQQRDEMGLVPTSHLILLSEWELSLKRTLVRIQTPKDQKPDGSMDTALLTSKKIKVLEYGDMNMVEYRSNTIGPSPLIRGRELRNWTLCANGGDQTDLWLAAVNTKGPWFTRQAMHWTRLDQARLDRCYISSREDCVSLLEEMVHDGTSSLADHIPIRISITRQDGTRTGYKKSYFKTDGHMLQNQEVLSKVRAEWAAHPSWAVDDRRKWGLALALTMAVLMGEKNKDGADMREAGAIHRKLAEVRLAIQENQSEDTRRNFEEALLTSRRRERLDV
ncbi:hypothetical protein R1sor_015374 [Riccia sorocarpa]|uniref:Uncharacterized protein n=1 Tax=Riccia sorocarpa TaxID=122646 RepID=A0ABD3HFC9_9MARC